MGSGGLNHTLEKCKEVSAVSPKATDTDLKVDYPVLDIDLSKN